VVDAAIGLGAVILPAPEHGIAGLDQLLKRPLRKVLAGLLADQLLVLDDDLFQRVGLQLVIELDLLPLLDAVKDVLELFLGTSRTTSPNIWMRRR